LLSPLCEGRGDVELEKNCQLSVEHNNENSKWKTDALTAGVTKILLKEIKIKSVRINRPMMDAWKPQALLCLKAEKCPTDGFKIQAMSAGV